MSAASEPLGYKSDEISARKNKFHLPRNERLMLRGREGVSD